MRLPFFASTSESKLYVSLLFYPDAVEAACWDVGQKGTASIIGAVTQEISTDSWDDRFMAAKTCLNTLKEVSRAQVLDDVVFGLPAMYLTSTEDISREVRSVLKRLSVHLGITPIGFVSTHQAIAHRKKKDEGVPLSAIVVSISSNRVSIALYKAGKAFGVRTNEIDKTKGGSLGAIVASALQEISPEEIIPSRIVLNVTDPKKIETYKGELMHFDFRNQVEMLHHPVVEVLTGDYTAIAVSLAGAQELTHTVDEDDLDDADILSTNQPLVATTESVPTSASDQVEEDSAAEVDKEDDSESVTDTTTFASAPNDLVINNVTTENNPDESDVNIMPVDAKAFGFDVTTEDEEVIDDSEDESTYEEGESSSSTTSTLVSKIKSLTSLSFLKPGVGHTPHQLGGKKMRYLVISLVVLITLLSAGSVAAFTMYLPEAEVVIQVNPEEISEQQDIIISTDNEPTSDEGIFLVGEVREQVYEGQKTANATGTKLVGEAAKGKVTLFNKSLSSRNLAKGTVVSTGGLDFTLDTEISIASASESLSQGTITYGKVDAPVTAKAIGANGNISAGRDFTVFGLANSVVSGRNEAAFSGGTSSEVTVVSRQDQEKLVTAIADELVEKAKGEFGNIETQETVMISDTIKTAITERNFSADIGQEAKEVTANITVTISGLSYNQNIVREEMKKIAEAKLPSGYEFSETIPQIDTSEPEVAEDGSVRMEASIRMNAIPRLDANALADSIAGKSTEEALTVIKQLTGVRDSTITVRRSLRSSILPRQGSKIHISVKE